MRVSDFCFSLFSLTFTLRSFPSEQLIAQGTAHDLVKLLRNELVPLNLLNFSLAFTDSALATKLGGAFTHSNVLD